MKNVIHIDFADTGYFRKGDIIAFPSASGTYKVVKVYNPTLFRRFLLRLGFKVRTKGIMAKQINK